MLQLGRSAGPGRGGSEQVGPATTPAPAGGEERKRGLSSASRKRPTPARSVPAVPQRRGRGQDSVKGRRDCASPRGRTGSRRRPEAGFPWLRPGPRPPGPKPASLPAAPDGGGAELPAQRAPLPPPLPRLPGQRRDALALSLSTAPGTRAAESRRGVSVGAVVMASLRTANPQLWNYFRENYIPQVCEVLEPRGGS